MIRRFQLHVSSAPKDGQDAAFNSWYDQTHFKDVTGLDWVHGGQRLHKMSGEGAAYLAIYEVEAEDPADIVPRLRAASANMQMTDTLDPASVSFQIFEVHEPA